MLTPATHISRKHTSRGIDTPHVQAEFENFKGNLHTLELHSKPVIIPNLITVDGEQKLLQPLALEYIRSYSKTYRSMMQSAIAIVSKAEKVLLAHKE